MSSDPLRDFILRDARNLHVAVAVSERWPTARKHIATTFLDRLGARLHETRPGWVTLKWEVFFEDQYASFHFGKAEWLGQYSVCLQAAEYGGKMLFGVQRDNNIPIVAGRPLSPEVLAAVRAVQPSARPIKWWDAWVPMRTPTPDWRTPDALWRMYTDGEFLEPVAEQMLGVARTVEPILDRLAKAEGPTTPGGGRQYPFRNPTG